MCCSAGWSQDLLIYTKESAACRKKIIGTTLQFTLTWTIKIYFILGQVGCNPCCLYKRKGEVGIDLIDSSAIISCAYPHLYHFPNWFLIVSLVIVAWELAVATVSLPSSKNGWSERMFFYSTPFHLGFLSRRKKKKNAEPPFMALISLCHRMFILSWHTAQLESKKECQIHGMVRPIPGVFALIWSDRLTDVTTSTVVICPEMKPHFWTSLCLQCTAENLLASKKGGRGYMILTDRTIWNKLSWVLVLDPHP